MHPILFTIKSTPIYTYGFFVALAMLTIFLLAGKRAKEFGIPQEMAVDLIFLFFVTGVVGARLFFILQHFDDYKGNILRAISIQEGGLVWYGGFITAAVVGVGYSILRKWPVLALCDFFAPLLPLAHAIGRLGCFFNGCCYGRVTRLPFGVTFPGDSVSRHPIQLYEAVFLIILSFFLFRLTPYRAAKEGMPPNKIIAGQLFIYYIIFYSAFRFSVESLRGDQVTLAFLTYPQWTSILLFTSALVFYFFILKRERGR